MESGYYKYIVFDYPLTQTTGKVFSGSDLGPEIEGIKSSVPNSYWISDHHYCVPIWYGWEGASLDVPNLQKLLLKR